MLKACLLSVCTILVFSNLSILQVNAQLPPEVTTGWRNISNAIVDGKFTFAVKGHLEKSPSDIELSQFSVYVSGADLALEALRSQGKISGQVVSVCRGPESFRVVREQGKDWVLDKYGVDLRPSVMQDAILVSSPFLLPTMTDTSLDSILSQNWVVHSKETTEDRLRLKVSIQSRISVAINGASDRTFEGRVDLLPGNHFAICELEGVATASDGKKKIDFPYKVEIQYPEAAADGRFMYPKSFVITRGLAPDRYFQNVIATVTPIESDRESPFDLKTYGLEPPSATLILSRNGSGTWYWVTGFTVAIAVLIAALVKVKRK